MKLLKTSHAVLLVLASVMAGTLSAAELTIAVGNIKTNVGNLNFAVYDNKKDWLGDDTVQQRSLVVSEEMVDGVITTRFELKPGDYAVSVHHDDNDNGKMDTNFIGIPKEPTGLSNGAVPKFGPPKYKDAVFSLTDDLDIRIDLLD